MIKSTIQPFAAILFAHVGHVFTKKVLKCLANCIAFGYDTLTSIITGTGRVRLDR
jgi:hypothetical protein